MKIISVALLCFSIVGCAGKPDGSSTDRAADATKAQGGVDVGNKPETCQIPGTSVYITHPTTWPCTEVKRSAAADTETVKKLIIANSSSSSIEASRAHLDLASPTPATLEKHLEHKYKDSNRDYKQIEINGLKGVRAEILNTLQEKQSDIYLVSELNDVIHITSQLMNSDDGFLSGENIISSVRLKYKGQAILNSVARTISVSGSSRPYSFSKEDFCEDSYTCTGIGKSYSSTELHLNYDSSGRFVRLGAQNEVDFDSIETQAEYLIAPNSKTLIEDIYNTFTPKDKHVEKTTVKVEAGDIYLIRTVDWPAEDLIVKLRIDAINSDGSLTLTYKKLISVPRSTLEKQIEVMNKYTLDNEAPREEGEVVLYNEDIWKNNEYARFNFKFSTSGNRFITKNTWDLVFHGCAKGIPTLALENGFARMVNFGQKNLQSIQKSDFPNLKEYMPQNCDTRIEIGKTYGIVNHKRGAVRDTTYGAVTILGMGENDSWVKLKFRRILVGPVERFEKWFDSSVDSTEVKELVHSKDYDDDDDINFRLFRFKREPIVSITLNDIYGTELCDYEKDCGIVNLGVNADFEKLTLQDADSKLGQFTTASSIKNGEVIIIRREDHLIKMVAVIKIDEITSEGTVKFRQRVLFHTIADNYYKE